MGLNKFTGLLFIFFITLFRCPITLGQEMTLDQLSNLIFDPSNKIKTLEDVLPKLPASLRTNYVLMVNSKSLQEGTKKNPRVIMFGRNGDIFISFNGGDENKYGGNTFESIQYHRENDSYEFREFAFKSQNGKDQIDEAPDRMNGYAAEFRNPNKCMACHGNPTPRLNWEPYPTWPGALPQSFRITPDERNFLTNFAMFSKKHPRYRFLMAEKNITANENNSDLGDTMASQMELKIREQAQRWFLTRLRHTKDFNKFEFAFLATLMDCGELEEFVPLSMKNTFNQSQQRSALIAEVKEDVSRRAPLHGIFNLGPEGARIVGGLRWLLENRDQDLGFWSFSFQSRYLFSTVPNDFFPPIINDLFAKDAGRMPPAGVFHLLNSPLGQAALVTNQDRTDQARVCTELRRMSLQRLAGMSGS